MNNFKAWIAAFRLRTLPLALSSILMGSVLAIKTGSYSWSVILLSVITTLLLQILSNLANDYGDGVKGTDNLERVGPKRALQSGEISPKEMRIGIFIFISLSLISGIWLIIDSLGSNWYLGLIFLTLGVVSIVAAIKYTVGSNAYGYSGFGDLFVFLFFGLLAVFGTYFLVSHKINFDIILPAISMGLFSAGVLNLNNMRDMDNDAVSNKHTLALKLGLKSAIKYHVAIIFIGMISAIAYTIINYQNLWQFIYLFSFAIMTYDLIRISNIKNKVLFDPFLSRLALSTLLFTVLFGLGLLI